MNLTTQSTIVWLTYDDMMDNISFRLARSNQLNIMISMSQTDGKANISNTTNTGILKFVDVESAQTWITFVQSLATEHNKNIVSTSVTIL